MDPLIQEGDLVLTELRGLNAKLERQGSISFIFMTGIIYGVGFVIGSAILASIVVGLIAPFVANIPWVQANFQRGSTLMHR